ncbi:PREDICTED: putative lysosomal acid lipase/cholesteryl ester hydrolase [Gekko japonicus]|uniref:Lysosomal acid lipase/cholesteryl ester hydrolase n=1 Tax=Gekko japonicus TaxID=146911 RepID=A0ABM1JX51_GEKJA|nr:PREDICTED: putative lysosomal acid lipase/cholesteryl ester hydrolase [Gekko japonicus]
MAFLAQIGEDWQLSETFWDEIILRMQTKILEAISPFLEQIESAFEIEQTSLLETTDPPLQMTPSLSQNLDRSGDVIPNTREITKDYSDCLKSYRMWLLIIMLVVQGTANLGEVQTKMNPEQFMNVSEKIQYWGYPCEEYEVLTYDSYYLSLSRIPGGSKGAILLMHSLLLEGSVWVANLPNNSLGFMLADAGYDVWIGNSRGNSWSRRHQFLTIDQQEFWDFSFHEMGIYDLSAMTDFILQKSGQEKIYYGGHGQGSILGFVAFSVVPQIAEKIKLFFVLGPAYTCTYSKSPLSQLLWLPETFLKIIFGTKELCLLSPSLKASAAQKCSCQLVDVLCEQALFLVSGFNEKNLNQSRTDVYVSIFPDYTSVKNGIHWSQSFKTGELRFFDYGSRNIEKYNQTIPPPYRIEEIMVPIAMWSGGQDWICQPDETMQLLSRITNLIHYKHFPDWNYWDFIWGLDAPQRMYAEVLGLMETHL